MDTIPMCNVCQLYNADDFFVAKCVLLHILYKLVMTADIVVNFNPYIRYEIENTIKETYS